MALEEGEVPADFLARLETKSPHESPHPAVGDISEGPKIDATTRIEKERNGGSPGTRALNQRVKSLSPGFAKKAAESDIYRGSREIH